MWVGNPLAKIVYAQGRSKWGAARTAAQGANL